MPVYLIPNALGCLLCIYTGHGHGPAKERAILIEAPIQTYNPAPFFQLDNTSSEFDSSIPIRLFYYLQLNVIQDGPIKVYSHLGQHARVVNSANLAVHTTTHVRLSFDRLDCVHLYISSLRIHNSSIANFDMLEKRVMSELHAVLTLVRKSVYTTTTPFYLCN